MTEQILDFLKEFNLHTIITCIIIAWYFVRDIKSSMKELKTEMKAIEGRLDSQISAQAARSDRLYEMFVDLLKSKESK